MGGILDSHSREAQQERPAENGWASGQAVGTGQRGQPERGSRGTWCAAAMLNGRHGLAGIARVGTWTAGVRS